MNKKEQLRKKIFQAELQIKRLNTKASNSDVFDDLYNSLVLQKAILKKELDDLSKNKIAEKIKKILPKKEKLICDYFN